MTRTERLAALLDALDGWTDDEDHLPTTATERYLLVERSTRDDRYWCSQHPDPEAAMRYSLDQEYAEDWQAEHLHDLDTGAVRTPGPARFVWLVTP